MVITLICTSGISTDIVVGKMKKVADAEDKIAAYSTRDMNAVVPKSDVVLLGPQAKAYLDSVKKIADPLGIPVDVIDFRLFGAFDGKQVYEFAKQVYAKGKSNK